ncbi:hypothetical protein [Paenibacillus radicis (ex Xue et al. 2023)]|uniref:Phage gp6-like head-tail connector protein n=1 Tax=Paenibacillus radicis (ex Xue et al. 2023) TaxID=2972489 RepID=A0ABT1YRG2_9BACL|nr:hypothetical protein [Paenibacillus radicis (ex Xue et al. 2023)]MCR8635751.1 hypothetical protein [Paenibacillus radicis (ex Xue et al. 2023)]
MTDTELLTACKIGLNIPLTSTAFDAVLSQKLFAVKGYMIGAGVSSSKFETDLSVGVIVMGVSDLWNTQNGEIKFSPVFHTLLTQLAVSSKQE